VTTKKKPDQETLLADLDAAAKRLNAAVSAVGDARHDLAVLAHDAHTIGLGEPIDPNKRPEVSGMGVVEGLIARNHEPFSWFTVEHALRGMASTAAVSAGRGLNPPQPKQPARVSEVEMLEWHIANGGDGSDSTGTVHDHFANQGPRRDDAARDAVDQEHRTRDQRTWH
jgi:hypothetical protein